MLEARGVTASPARTCLVIRRPATLAIYTIEKLYQLGARPITCSDSRGTIHHPEGIDLETLSCSRRSSGPHCASMWSTIPRRRISMLR